MKYTKEILESIVRESLAISEVLRKLGLRGGGSHNHILQKIKYFEIDTSHFLGQSWNKGRPPYNIYTKDEFISKVLIKNNGKNLHSTYIKGRLFKFGLKEERCEECDNPPIWNNKVLKLHLDHINGDYKDNRLENLRILCPNCHSQTETYSRAKKH